MNIDPSEQVQSRNTYRSKQRSVWGLWVLVVILILWNVALLFGLNLARQIAIETLLRAETMLDRLASETITYNIAINQAVPMKADIPFNQTIEIPVKTSLDLALGSDVPIDTAIAVDFNDTISVDTVVHLNTTVPVEIDIARTSLAGYLIQTRQDVAKLRRLLSFQFGNAPGDPITMDGADESNRSTGSAGPAPESRGETVSGAQVGRSAGAASDPGQCAHPYWPLDSGATWTYSSPASSFIQRVDTLTNNQALLSTQYEGRDINFHLDCSQAGLGGSYLGDVRRLTELGALTFSQPDVPFLPGVEVIERIGEPWSQELDISGTVQARQGTRMLEGRVRQGQARAVYTPTGFETITTPFGPKEALRIEQKLELNLEIDFDLGNQNVPVTEQASLANVYWFARDVGLVKLHWQGGRLRRTFELNQAPVSEDIAIVSLPEDVLISSCLLDQQSLTCKFSPDATEASLTPSTNPELDIPPLVFPENVGSADGSSSLPGQAGAEETADTAIDNGDTGNNEAAAPPTVTPPQDQDSSALLTYAAAAGELGQRINDISKSFAQTALRYRNNELSRDEFRADFRQFRDRIKNLIEEIDRLSPPPAAGSVHQKLTGGLDKCDQAIDLMASWFDTSDSDTRNAATLLTGACTSEVNAAQNELADLISQ